MTTQVTKYAGEHGLDENGAMMLGTVRQFARERVLPGVIERDREERFDRQLVRELGELDLLVGINPPEWGGLGLSHVTYSALVQEMSRVDHLMGLLMTFPSGLGGSGLLQYGTDEQRERYLEPLCRGEILISAGVTEPASGTAVADMQTVCRRDGDEYVIDGAKTWISLIDVCDYLLTFATLAKGGGATRSVRFSSPATHPG